MMTVGSELKFKNPCQSFAMSLFGKNPSAKLDKYLNSRKRRDAPIPPPLGRSNKIIRTVNGQREAEVELTSIEEVRNKLNEIRQASGVSLEHSSNIPNSISVDD